MRFFLDHNIPVSVRTMLLDGLRCQPPRAALILQAHLGEVLDLLHRDHVAISVSDRHVRAWSHPSD